MHPTRFLGVGLMLSDLMVRQAINTAKSAPNTMESDRIFNLNLFREIMVEQLTARGLCAAWDYGNEIGDEIFVRSADGCVAEQYDLITGDGQVRNANKQALSFHEGFGVPVVTLQFIYDVSAIRFSSVRTLPDLKLPFSREY
jgi:hypothetical protein